MVHSILVIEDEEDVAELIEFHLEKEGYHVRLAADSATAFRYMRANPPDLVLLDIMLPGTSGIEILKRIKSNEQLKHVQVIMVSAKGEDVDQIVGLELGAHDYIVKPFSPRVLVARVKRLLRDDSAAPATNAKSEIRVGELVIAPGKFKVEYKGEEIKLTQGEFKVLTVLADRPGWVHSREQIIKSINQNNVVTERAVDVQIVGLRKKMGEAGAMVQTVRGAGYKLDTV